MPLITKKSFIDLFPKGDCSEQPEGYDAENFPYIGMGNPDSKLLLVGAEKALDHTNPLLLPIFKHELILNYSHWCDIVNNHLSKTAPFDSILLSRGGVLNDFNPFSPLLFPATITRVRSRGRHTYRKMEIIINWILSHICGLPATSIWEHRPSHYSNSTFSKCFITELSDIPALKNKKFDYPIFNISPRGKKMISGKLGLFYQDFEKIVIYNKSYCGSRGSIQRDEIIKIFNPSLIEIRDFNPIKSTPYCDVYTPKSGGAEVFICDQLTSRRFNANETLQAFGDIIGSIC